MAGMILLGLVNIFGALRLANTAYWRDPAMLISLVRYALLTHPTGLLFRLLGFWEDQALLRRR